MARLFIGGTNNYLFVGDPDGILDPTTNAFSFGGWVKATSNSGASQVIFAKWNGTSGWIMFMQGSGVIRCQIANGAAADDTAALSIGDWHHLMFVRDASALRFYRDGVERSNNGSASNLANTALAFSWGHRTSGTTPAFKGSIAEFAAWSSVLTPAEVAALAMGASPLSVRSSSLVYQPGWGAAGSTAGEPDVAGAGVIMSVQTSLAVVDHAPVCPPFPIAA